MTSFPSIRMTRGIAEALLVLAMLFWGTTFVIVKDAIETIPVHWFHFLRFSAGALCIWAPLLLFGGGTRRISRGSVAAGGVLGVFLFSLFATQTIGLVTTTASKSAFITATSVLWVPALAVLVMRRRLDRVAVAAGCTGLVGIFLLMMDQGWSSFHPDQLVRGDFWTMACAVSVAVHLLATKRLSPQFDTWVLTAVQLSVVAGLSLALSFALGEQRSFAYGMRDWGAITYLAVITTAGNIWILTYAQRFTTPQRSAVIFLVEPLFAAFTSWLVLGEVLGLAQWVGALLILGGMVAIECVPRRSETQAADPQSQEKM